MSDTGDKEPVDEERSRLDNFVQITGSGAVKTRDFLEWCMRDLGVIIESIYARLDGVDEQPGNPNYEPSDSDMSELMPEEQAAPTYPGRKKAKEEKSRAIADLEESDSSDDEDNQAYYAGGSEHSGQQILGPPTKKRRRI